MDDRYDRAFSQELADIGNKAVKFVIAELQKTSKPYDPCDVALVLQSGIIDHIDAFFTAAAMGRQIPKAEIERTIAEQITECAQCLSDHAKIIAARADQVGTA